MDERRDDWRHGVDENLASLNAGQRVQDDKLQKLETAHDDLHAEIHGEIDSGLIGRMEELEGFVARLNSAIFMDVSGKKGMQHDVQQLLEGREDRRLGWANITKIVVALIMAGLVGRFYGDIWKFFDRKSADPVEQKIEHVKHPRRTHYVIHEIPADAEENQ